MQRFFFDFTENGEREADCDGIELVDAPTAKAEAAKALAEAAMFNIVTGRRCSMRIEIRNATGVVSTIRFCSDSDNHSDS